MPKQGAPKHGIWYEGFSKIGVPPNHPFIDGIFPYRPSSYWGIPIDGKALAPHLHAAAAGGADEGLSPGSGALFQETNILDVVNPFRPKTLHCSFCIGLKLTTCQWTDDWRSRWVNQWPHEMKATTGHSSGNAWVCWKHAAAHQSMRRKGLGVLSARSFHSFGGLKAKLEENNIRPSHTTETVYLTLSRLWWISATDWPCFPTTKQLWDVCCIGGGNLRLDLSPGRFRGLSGNWESPILMVYHQPAHENGVDTTISDKPKYHSLENVEYTSPEISYPKNISLNCLVYYVLAPFLVQFLTISTSSQFLALRRIGASRSGHPLGGSWNGDTSIVGWFVMEKPIKMDDFGVPHIDWKRPCP